MRAGADPAAARAGLVLLHGRGGSAGDLVPLLRAAGLTDVAALAPQAPGHSWWPTSFLAPQAQIEAHVTRGLAAVAAAVGDLVQAGLPRGRIWLCGFSQGAWLALESFARQGDGLAGVLAFSGGLVGTGDAPGPAQPALLGYGPKRFDYPGRRDGAQVWIGVHQADPHIPLARVQDSATVLRGLGAQVTVQVHPGAGHGVMPSDVGAVHDLLAA
ncbi:MAG: dienelactone hydrolase family protein [Rhodobacterales bacterium]|nr:dienelactone hydrolase family protein [Rhodobacterales bacterium]